jgi:hypothetical protein
MPKLPVFVKSAISTFFDHNCLKGFAYLVMALRVSAPRHRTIESSALNTYSSAILRR